MALVGALTLFFGGASAVVTFVLATHAGAGAAFCGAFALFFLVVGIQAVTATLKPRDELMSPRTWRGLAATLALGGLVAALAAPWYETIPWFVLALLCLVRVPAPRS